MKKTAVLLFLTAISFSRIPAQEHLSVDISHPVYQLLEIGELKGAIERLSMVKPYSYNQIARYLRDIEERAELFSSYEKKILTAYIEEFCKDKNGIFYGNLAYEDSRKSAYIGTDILSTIRINTEALSDWHLHNAIRGYIKGDISDYFSYYGAFGFTYDRVRYTAFPLYGFTKDWDVRHINFGDERYSQTGTEEIPYFSYFIETDLGFGVLDNDVTAHFAKYRRQWGYGEGALSLSETARPFIGVEMYIRPVAWLGFGHLVGSLNNRLKEGRVKSGEDALTYQKMYTLQTVEFFPFPWFSLSATGSVIWGKRLELGYMIPLFNAMIFQNISGDFENVAQEISARFIIPKIGSLYFSFFADEMEFTTPDEFFKRPRNLVAYQAGIKVPVPGLPLTLGTVQYTKIEPFVYTHYPEDNYPYYTNPVDMNYTHDDENLGFRTPPNSDEILIKLETIPRRNISASLSYQLIRHGTNNFDIKGDLAIYGDMDIYMNYSEITNYPDKDFLRDGIYDWNNIVSLKASYTFDFFPLTLSGEYTFAHTFWRTNNSGVTPPPPEVRNIFSIQVDVWR